MRLVVTLLVVAVFVIAFLFHQTQTRKKKPDEFVLPGSPNWFLSSVSSGTDAGLYAFGSKNHVFVYDLREVSQARHDEGTPQFGVLSQKMPKLISCFKGHDLKVSSVCLSPDPEQWVCCSADEATVKLWDVMSLTILKVHTEHKVIISTTKGYFKGKLNISLSLFLNLLILSFPPLYLSHFL